MKGLEKLQLISQTSQRIFSKHLESCRLYISHTYMRSYRACLSYVCTLYVHSYRATRMHRATELTGMVHYFRQCFGHYWKLCVCACRKNPFELKEHVSIAYVLNAVVCPLQHPRGVPVGTQEYVHVQVEWCTNPCLHAHTCTDNTAR